jgi:hypothetical protein
MTAMPCPHHGVRKKSAPTHCTTVTLPKHHDSGTGFEARVDHKPRHQPSVVGADIA